ncbi:MAG TPA: calcium/sodium antiporter [Sedimentisphaerales bacterium]|nr:calcium/sodium antiporter [Sedimentisphaerales bacterium]HRS10971.1 calcium/sodium antiporter [Sedimentisphaerales bacterium]HRV48665.1 calcium/sodium antiporter [Sedimentisphaerales bacterium]
MAWAIVFLTVGLLLLWKGADLLVNGAVGIAQRLGVSQLVVGLTVVAMGTSAPEVAASIASALGGRGDIAIGNVYGSNIANLALVAGLVSLINPLRIQAQTLRREIPTLLIVSLVLWPILRDRSLSRPEGLLLFVLFIGLLVYTVRAARRGALLIGAGEVPVVAVPSGVGNHVVLIGVGLAGLSVGARLAVGGAVKIGTFIGLSDAVIGSTIMAVGTSLPELVTCILAALRDHHDISVGNLVGSNIFNTLLVSGAAALVRPFAVDHRFAGGIDFWVMIGVGVAFAISAIVGRRVIGRAGGVLLLSIYGAYLAYLLACGPTP